MCYNCVYILFHWNDVVIWLLYLRILYYTSLYDIMSLYIVSFLWYCRFPLFFCEWRSCWITFYNDSLVILFLLCIILWEILLITLVMVRWLRTLGNILFSVIVFVYVSSILLLWALIFVIFYCSNCFCSILHIDFTSMWCRIFYRNA